MTSSSKRVTEMQPVDRLSALPDSLLIHILSFLEMKETPIAAVLSKRWQSLWTQSPRFVFKGSNSRMDRIRDFVTRVHRTLIVCGGQKGFESFEVEFLYHNTFSSDVDVWVDFAVKNKAKQISLLLNYSFSNGFYTLPQKIFHSSCLKRLNFQRCVVSPRRTIEWQSLTELTIDEVELQQHVIEKILSGCPVLYCLFLQFCWGFNRLQVDSKSLYELRVIDPDGVNEPLLQISAPYLRSLCFYPFPKGRKLRLENISSLVRASIGFIGADWDTGSVEVMNNAKELLENTRHVNLLGFTDAYSEVLSLMAMDGYQFPQSTRTRLLVKAPTEARSSHGIVVLLESSPNLEALVIEGFSFDGDPYSCPDAKGDMNCDLLHLKTITIRNFVHPSLVGEPLLTLARILLNKAPALERMVVNTEDSEPFKIAQTLLSYPRSSKKAVIILS